MKARVLTALVAALSLGGCIIYENPGHGGGGYTNPPASALPGDLTLSWSFGGRSCAQIPEVRSVVVSIPGEGLENGGVYSCRSGGFDGIRLADFAPGFYSFSVRALGYASEELFSASGSFRIDGSVSVGVDLLPVFGPNSYAYVFWSLPGGQSCSQAGIETVVMSIDGGAFESHRCEDGMYQPGVRTPMLSAGRHSIEIWALDDWGYDWFFAQSELETWVAAPIAAEYSLRWSVGGVALSWQLTDGAFGESCYGAGIDTVYIDLEDMDGNLVFSGSSDMLPCDSGPALYVLAPGVYRVFISATGPWGALYESNTRNPPVVTVTAGVFPGELEARTVQLYAVY